MEAITVMDMAAVAFKAIGLSFLIAGSVGLVCTCVYRLYLHPLARYPGPTLAKLTNLYSAYHAWRGSIHTDMWRCHEKYGEQLRYAPNRLIFYTADAINDIYGNRNNVVKSTVYKTLVHRAANTLTLRDKKEHARSRRIMSAGFSDASLRLLEPKILLQIQKLLLVLDEALDEKEQRRQLSKGEWSRPHDMAKLCDYHAFDLMSTLIYSASSDTLATEDLRYVPRAIGESNIRMSVLLQAPELRTFKLDAKLFKLSIIARNAFVKFVGSTVAARVGHEKSEGLEHDIFSIFQHARDPETGKGFGLVELAAESSTLIVAGSDTTSTTLAGLLYYLSQNQYAYEQVVNEVREVFSSLAEIQIGSKLGSCVYLRACIDETLRMSPPTGSALWREVSAGGANIAGNFVPEGYDVGVAIYAVHHNSAYHPEPFQFRPERFLGDGESKAMERSAFMPFSIGTRGCIGKGLAVTEIMLTMASLLWTYDFRRYGLLEEKENKEYELRDHITVAKEGPVLEFRLRNLD